MGVPARSQRKTANAQSI